MRTLNNKIIQTLPGLFVLLIPFLGISQQHKDESILLQQIQTEEKSQQLKNSSIVSGLFLKQVGVENQAFVQQQGLPQDQIQQLGSINVVFLVHSGYASQIRVDQIGIANQYTGIVLGDGIEASILQQGDYNTIDQSLIGDQLMFGIIQEGNRNEIQHTAEGSSGPIKIYQRGNDMRIIIKSNN
jgi:hypothetical protein